MSTSVQPGKLSPASSLGENPHLFGDVYKEVLTCGTILPSEIAANLGKAPIKKVKLILDELHKVGIIHHSNTDTKAVRAVSPPLAFARAVDSLIDRLSENLYEVNEIARVISLSAVECEHLPNSDIPQVEVLAGADAISTRLNDLTNSARTSVDSLVPTIPTPESLKSAMSGDLDLSKRDIKLRALYPEAARISPLVMEYLETIGGVDTTIRTCSTTPLRLVIVDGTKAFIRYGVADEFQSAVVTNNAEMVDALADLFEALWAHSTGLDITAERADGGISERKKAILNCALLKDTDEAIARELGVSVRTVRRDITELYQLSDTRTRFALGIQAERLGWLEN